MIIRGLVASAALVVVFAGTASAQTPAAAPAGQDAPSKGRIGVAVSATTLGIGLDGAFRISKKANVRVGGHLFNLTHDFDDNDITYQGELNLRSVHAYFDWFPIGGGFHISPGIVLHNGNKATLSARLMAGESVELDGESYYSSASDPIRALGTVTSKSGRPALLLGWGNIVPQSRRFSVPFQLGVVFQGAPTGTLSFTGTACAANGLNCRNMSTDAAIQNDVRAEEASLNDDLRKYLRFYPVLSLGVAFRF